MKGKKACAVLLAAAMALGMAGCGNHAAGNGVSQGNAPAEDKESQTQQGQADREQTQQEQTGQASAEQAVSQTETEAEKREESPTETASDGQEEKSAKQEDNQEDREEAMSGEYEIISVPEWEAKEIPRNEALALVEDMRLGWNLGNTFDATNCGVSDELEYESAWVGVATTKEMIHTIKDAGFQTIRIPVSWHNHVDENDQISKAWMDRVQEVVDWSLEEGLYVIINIHHDNEEGFMYPSYEHLDRSKKYVQTVWKQIAERFAEYDERLLYETMNEPRHVGTDHEWWIDVNSETGKECIDCVNQLNQAAVDTIRANGKGYNPTRYIMTPGYCASPDYALADGFVLPTDSGKAENRILVSVHAYTPYLFALAAETEKNSTDQFSVSRKMGTADIDAFMGKLYDKFISQGTGVVIGEFGARAKGNNIEARTEFAAYYVARARSYGMTACWWDNNAFGGSGENFGILRRVKSQIFYPQIVEQMVYYSQADHS